MNGKEVQEGMPDSGISHHAKDAILTFFERLVSIVRSDLSEDELYYITSELWRRFTHIQKHEA